MHHECRKREEILGKVGSRKVRTVIVICVVRLTQNDCESVPITGACNCLVFIHPYFKINTHSGPPALVSVVVAHRHLGVVHDALYMWVYCNPKQNTNTVNTYTPSNVLSISDLIYSNLPLFCRLYSSRNPFRSIYTLIFDITDYTLVHVWLPLLPTFFLKCRFLVFLTRLCKMSQVFIRNREY